MSDVTRILSQIEQGDPQAASKLLPLVYEELKKLAAVRLSREKPGHTLSATSLVHEAYVRLVGPSARNTGPEGNALRGGPVGNALRGGPVGNALCGVPESDANSAEPQTWNSRGHFFSAAAEAMRRILVESARRKKQLKRGGEYEQIDFTTDCIASEGPSLDLLALDEALTKFAAASPERAELVKLRYFAGLTMHEAAQALCISLSTAERQWAFAKAWLRSELQA
jgi:RNA polymerase sigma factor (sigma-70 family)